MISWEDDSCYDPVTVGDGGKGIDDVLEILVVVIGGEHVGLKISIISGHGIGSVNIFTNRIFIL